MLLKNNCTRLHRRSLEGALVQWTIWNKVPCQTAWDEQKDPLVVYKGEAYMLFKQMDTGVNKDIVNFLLPCRYSNGAAPATLADSWGPWAKDWYDRMRANKEQVDAAGQEYGANEKTISIPHRWNMSLWKLGLKSGRNDPARAGSGKKYKKLSFPRCCLKYKPLHSEGFYMWRKPAVVMLLNIVVSLTCTAELQIAKRESWPFMVAQYFSVSFVFAIRRRASEKCFLIRCYW